MNGGVAKNCLTMFGRIHGYINTEKIFSCLSNNAFSYDTK
ncbi:hypothetical protein CP02DC15_0788 [Chlamydia psittaci 02DC15]|uniref:Uncharacterized protein n=1 Tax=Chlamydia psittaci 99DC5 TaxID=1112251 RepID=A0ABN0MPZ3_CHLPS|nr:hypothetical protein B598_0012 [Chlamydia psittaci GR9]EPJ13434.1 hypothetical protein CP02DC15_0788 [Chlamydia psittaci 02DC15]EPJ15830.1 hypothetical protein CP02DC18_0430 [Chlamydia psittaci 02DC18]EPJ25251.1 hypothetical protein CP09DC77_0421 [Chlamydia psittaci 09DC77]EPJ26843.1 hypothetical protein CP09DC80_0419 [Chlamydia psittaci 09DC80]EPJ28388.1 hypothetical protein CP99DC5_0424 [Chlamydia psittaci 99DC5]